MEQKGPGSRLVVHAEKHGCRAQAEAQKQQVGEHEADEQADVCQLEQRMVSGEEIDVDHLGSGKIDFAPLSLQRTDQNNRSFGDNQNDIAKNGEY